MSVVKSHDINELRSVLPFGKVEPGDIVKHVDDDNSFGTVVCAETPTKKPRPQTSPFPRDIYSPHPSTLVPERNISVLWTKEPKLVQVQIIKNRSPSPIKSRWDIEEAEDLVAMGDLSGRVPLRHSRQFITEETYDHLDNDEVQKLLDSGANIEIEMNGTVTVKRNLPATEENIRKFNALRGINYG